MNSISKHTGRWKTKLLVLAIITLVIIAGSKLNTLADDEALSFSEIDQVKAVHRFAKPLTWTKGNAKIQVLKIGRSSGLNTADEPDNLFITFKYSAMAPLHLTSIKLVDKSGKSFIDHGYSISSDTSGSGDGTFYFNLPSSRKSTLCELTGTFDNSYTYTNRYAPKTISELSKPFHFKDGNRIMLLHDIQVSSFPGNRRHQIDYMGDKPNSNTADKSNYLIMRFFVLQRDKGFSRYDPDLQVYGNDNRWISTYWENRCPHNTGYTGLQVPYLDKENKGIIISAIDPVSPAFNAGFLVGDKITSIDGQQITDVDAYGDIVHSLPPGKPVRIMVSRNGKDIDLIITPVEYPIWAGMNASESQAAKQLSSLIKPGSGWTMSAYTYISKQPVASKYKPIKVKFIKGEESKPSKIVKFKINNIPLPSSIL
ncbi:MAG: PDZ domain-containing protein [Armatimonadota bacterium]